jgi:hypothetical protein
MPTQSAPIVSLQAPKDVSLSDIEAELSKIWQSYGVAATRATTFSLVVYEPEETQHLLAALRFYSGQLMDSRTAHRSGDAGSAESLWAICDWEGDG